MIAVVMFSGGLFIGMAISDSDSSEPPAASEESSSSPAESETTASPKPALPPAEPNPMEAAIDSCASDSDRITLADDGNTIVAEGIGIDGETDESIEQLVCVLVYLGAPDSLFAHLDSTRAIDGRQEDEFGEYTAAWTFHPDDGVNMTITTN
ncbi:hypothetical protein AB0K52_08575 [Glycomyces sp. NPDC049804]|uniref:hypothetical protein n=1 Tax=Glycomyces sp. NPDC049804 TaxID=3154363 RepID=UPI00341F6826